MVHFRGKVTRLYSTLDRTYIQLGNNEWGELPPNGYFALVKAHTNYSSVFELAMLAAKSGANLQIKTWDIFGFPTTAVQYVVVEFPLPG